MLLPTRRLFALLLVISVFAMSVREVTDPDFWWHLRTGQYILETKTIPHADIYSSTANGNEWVAHEWLSELIIFAVYSWTGIGGLIIGFSALIALTFWLNYLSCPGRPYIAGFSVMLGALTTAPVWGVRPQIFTLLLTSIFLLTLDHYLRGGSPRSLFILMPLTILWVNLHSGFALGLVIIAITAAGVAIDEVLKGSSLDGAGKRVFPLAVVLGACLFAVLINPNGARMYSYPFETLSSRAMQAYIQEWFSPDFHLIEWQPFAIMLLAPFCAMALSRERVRIGDLLLLIILAYAGLRSARNVPIYALVAAPILAQHIGGFLARLPWQFRLESAQPRMGKLVGAINAGILTVVLVAAGFRTWLVIANQDAAVEKVFPVAAVDYIKSNHPPTPIYNSYTWGGYLIWRLYPDYSVFVDGRADVYGDSFLEYYLLAYRGREDWRKPLEEHSIRTIIVESDAPLVKNLLVSGEWQLLYRDSLAVVFSR